jgi:hypothetical protein
MTFLSLIMYCLYYCEKHQLALPLDMPPDMCSDKVEQLITACVLACRSLCMGSCAFNFPTSGSTSVFLPRGQRRAHSDLTRKNAVQDSVALKFFTDSAGFANEQRACSNPAVAEAIGSPPVFILNSDCAAMMPTGIPFPPFTVSEKGQPLDVWMKRFRADTITSMQVCSLVSAVLAFYTWCMRRE